MPSDFIFYPTVLIYFLQIKLGRLLCPVIVAILFNKTIFSNINLLRIIQYILVSQKIRLLSSLLDI